LLIPCRYHDDNDDDDNYDDGVDDNNRVYDDLEDDVLTFLHFS
jgi:hypothetical protein